MPVPGSGDDGNAAGNYAQFDLMREIADSERQKPWPAGIHTRILDKKPDFRVVLIFMETGARLREHHVGGTSSVQVLMGRIRYSTGGQAYDLQAGSLITLGASIAHDVESLDESAFLLTFSWPGDRQRPASTA
jgi:quercetin dioxygenase-like cupin family protein